DDRSPETVLADAQRAYSARQYEAAHNLLRTLSDDDFPLDKLRDEYHRVLHDVQDAVDQQLQAQHDFDRAQSADRARDTRAAIRYSTLAAGNSFARASIREQAQSRRDALRSAPAPAAARNPGNRGGQTILLASAQSPRSEPPPDDKSKSEDSDSADPLR